MFSLCPTNGIMRGIEAPPKRLHFAYTAPVYKRTSS